MKHRIRNGRGGGALGGFTCTQWRIERFSILRIAGHEVYLYLRHFTETQDRVGIPMRAGDIICIPMRLFFQGPAGRLNSAAFQLRDGTVGMDDFCLLYTSPSPRD